MPIEDLMSDYDLDDSEDLRDFLDELKGRIECDVKSGFLDEMAGTASLMADELMGDDKRFDFVAAELKKVADSLYEANDCIYQITQYIENACRLDDDNLEDPEN